MININFYVKSMGSFIILSVMWYERLTKCYLLYTNPSKFMELEKTCQVSCFLLSTLNHLSFTEHTSWPSKPRLPKFPRWDSWAWIMSQKMRWCAMSLNHGLWRLFVWIWALLGFRRDFSKIYDSVDVAWVANEIKPCGMKNLSLTPVLSEGDFWTLGIWDRRASCRERV